jgi:hypothetical protein
LGKKKKKEKLMSRIFITFDIFFLDFYGKGVEVGKSIHNKRMQLHLFGCSKVGQSGQEFNSSQETITDKETRCVSYCGLVVYIKKYVKAKEE